jgi:hypothetical protein
MSDADIKQHGLAPNSCGRASRSIRATLAGTMEFSANMIMKDIVSRTN